MRSDESVIERMARDALWIVVLTGVFWLLGKVVKFGFWLLGLAVVASNELLILLMKPIIYHFRRRRFERRMRPEVVDVRHLEWIDSSAVQHQGTTRETYVLSGPPLFPK